MARNAHDDAGAVAHKDIVGDEHRDGLAGRRVDGLNAIETDARLFLVQLAALKVGLAGGRLLIGFNVGPVFDLILPLGQQRMFRGNDRIGHAEERIDAGGVDGDIVGGVGLEGDLRAGGAADPVLLLGLDALDVVQPLEVEIVDQAVGILRDAEHPLALFLADDRRAAALTDALDDLLVRQHALAAGAPVDGHGGLIGKAVLVHLEEDPLRPAVVIRVGRIDDAIPVEAVAEHFELAGKVLDVPLGDDGGMDVVLDGEVFRRQTKGIKADGVQDVIALHPLLAADNVHRRERARVADVKAGGGGVREFDQAVELGLPVAGDGGVGLGLLPLLLPFLFNGCKIVFHNRLLCLVI